MESLHLEDFRLGQRFVSAEFVLSDDEVLQYGEVSGDRHPMHTPGAVPADRFLAQGPLGIARYFGTVFDSGLLTTTIVAALDTHWYYRAPLLPGVRLRFETLVTGWRRSSDPQRGVLHRSVRLLDADDTLVQEGSCAALVRTADPLGADDPAAALPLSPAWATAVVGLLEDSADFHDATQLYDGTIGLASDVADIQLRVYKGQVLDVARRTPRGADFTVRADARHWAELLVGGRNDFVVRANRGEFSVSGDVYGYLQLTKALHLLIDAGRALTADEVRA